MEQPRVLVAITSYNREESLCPLIINIGAEYENCDFVVFDDRSDAVPFLKESEHLKIIISPEHRGKAGFWKTYNDIFAYCKEHEYDYYIILPDDVEPCPDFVNKAIEAYDKAGCICLSLLLTNRSFWNGFSRWGLRNVLPRDWGYLSHYFDCEGIMKRDFFEALDWHLAPMVHSGDPYRSSGVGMQITKRLQAKGLRLGHVKQTLLATTEGPSVMNELERKRHPLFADWRDNEPCVDVHMASLWRGGHVVKTVESLMKQPELNQIFITLNSYTQEQYKAVKYDLKVLSEKYGKKVTTRKANNEKASNEKLSQLPKSKTKYIAFADDDVIYPPDYLRHMIAGCNANNAMVSLHGGIFVEWPIRKYYGQSRQCLSWQRQLQDDAQVDVLGNVFTLFRREWFSTEEMTALYKNATAVSMDDIYLACLASQKGIRRVVLEHRYDVGSPLCPTHKEKQPGDNYVYDQYCNSDSEQVEYLNEHYKRYEK